MSHGKVVTTLLLAISALLVSAASASPISDTQAAQPVIRTTLQADLTLKSAIAPELFSIPAFHQKTCRCSCGFPCNQDDDCGPGGSCEQFISCCDRNQTSQSSTQSGGRSTRRGEVQPVLNLNCK